MVGCCSPTSTTSIWTPCTSPSTRPTRRALHPDLAALRADLRRLRKRGFALNVEDTESGVTAVGYPVRSGDGKAVAAVSVSVPSSRFSESRLTGLVAALAVCVRGIERDLDRHTHVGQEAP